MSKWTWILIAAGGVIAFLLLRRSGGVGRLSGDVATTGIVLPTRPSGVPTGTYQPPTVATGYQADTVAARLRAGLSGGL